MMVPLADGLRPMPGYQAGACRSLAVADGSGVVARIGQQGQEPVTGTPRGRGRRVDDLDRRIIKMLQVDGRLSNTEIARSLEITETTVRKRIAHLLDERLMSIVAVPTPEASGMLLSAILGVSVELTAIHAVADTIRTYPEVRYVGMSAGRYDLMVEAFFTDQEHLLEFVTGKLGCLPGITSLETSIILKVVKFSYEWEIT
jgi:Lrp/AsnC family transcriptional regulator, regulator for asnA, asnC and gidA